MKYIITGDKEEIINLAKPAREEGRFMSDTPNLDGFKWYPLDNDTDVLEVFLEAEAKPIDDKELAILSREYTSITIGVVSGNNVDKVIFEGEVEAFID